MNMFYAHGLQNPVNPNATTSKTPDTREKNGERIKKFKNVLLIIEMVESMIINNKRNTKMELKLYLSTARSRTYLPINEETKPTKKRKEDQVGSACPPIIKF